MSIEAGKGKWEVGLERKRGERFSGLVIEIFLCIEDNYFGIILYAMSIEGGEKFLCNEDIYFGFIFICNEH